MDVPVLGLPAWVWAVLMGLAWATFDAARKSLAVSVPLVPVLTWIALGHLPLFGAWAVVELASRPPGEPFPWTAAYVAPGSLLLVANVLANLSLLQALRLSPISITIPILSFTPVFVALLAWPILGQVPSWLQALGIALIVLGAILINTRRGDAAHPWRLVVAIAREPGSLWMLLAAFGWSLTMVLDVICLRHTTISLHVTIQLAALSLVLLGYLMLRRRTHELRHAMRRIRMLTLGIVAASLALGLQLILIAYVHVGLIESLKRAIGMTAAVVSGALFFSEAVTLYKVLAVLLMTGGVYLIVV